MRAMIVWTSTPYKRNSCWGAFLCWEEIWDIQHNWLVNPGRLISSRSSPNHSKQSCGRRWPKTSGESRRLKSKKFWRSVTAKYTLHVDTPFMKCIGWRRTDRWHLPCNLRTRICLCHLCFWDKECSIYQPGSIQSYSVQDVQVPMSKPKTPVQGTAELASDLDKRRFSTEFHFLLPSSVHISGTAKWLVCGTIFNTNTFSTTITVCCGMERLRSHHGTLGGSGGGSPASGSLCRPGEQATVNLWRRPSTGGAQGVVAPLPPPFPREASAARVRRSRQQQQQQQRRRVAQQ